MGFGPSPQIRPESFWSFSIVRSQLECAGPTGSIRIPQIFLLLVKLWPTLEVMFGSKEKWGEEKSGMKKNKKNNEEK